MYRTYTDVPETKTIVTFERAVESRVKALAFATTNGLRRREEVDASGAITTHSPRHICGEEK